MKRIISFFLLPVFVSILAILLFFMAALIPQEAIQENVEISTNQLLSHFQWEDVFNKGDPTYKMDICTDSMILLQAYNMNTDDSSSIFKNPKHISKEADWNVALALKEVVFDGAENEENYSRYWMGFRFVIRPLLLFANYYTIRKTVAACFFILLFLCVGLIGKRFGIKGMLCFGIPMTLMNPAVISHSLQFTCDFNLAFLFMIFVLLTDCKKISIPILFCSFGLLTQLFDFYSTPLITYGLPLLLILAMEEYTDKRWRTALAAMGAWSYGYAFMWICKMACTTIFTDANGFREAFGSFAYRIGIDIGNESKEIYDPIRALNLVYNNIFIDKPGNTIFFLLVIVTVIAIVISFLTRTKKEALSLGCFLFIGVLPLVWFAVAAQPTVIHYWFQYRTVIVTFVSLFVYLTYAFSKSKDLLNRKKHKENQC